jgi:hypothetical protein
VPDVLVERAGGRAMVADQMGLGKTIVTIVYAAKNKLKTLIVCPKSTVPGWTREIKRFVDEWEPVEIENIQNFFDGSDYGKIFGNILVRHKYPIDLTFSIQYTGSVTNTQLTDSIKQYFDDNNDGKFIVRDFISYLYNQQLVNNVKEPITFSYTRYDDNNELIIGEFTDSIETRLVDFYRVANITVNKL